MHLQDIMKRIIIIEDHPVVVFNLKIGLNGVDGIEVMETFNSGRAVKNSSALEHIDVALLDINLPDINGFELCQYIHQKYPNIKIIGISSFEDYEHISKFIELGAHGYIVKGAKNSVMVEAINAVLEGKSFYCEIAQQAMNSVQTNISRQIILTKRERKLIELAESKLTIEKISENIEEDLETTKMIFKMLLEKLEFYKIEISFDIPQGL